MPKPPMPAPPMPGNFHFGKPVSPCRVRMIEPPTPETVKAALEWKKNHVRFQQRYEDMMYYNYPRCTKTS